MKQALGFFAKTECRNVLIKQFVVRQIKKANLDLYSQNKFNMVAVQLQKLGFDKFGGVVGHGTTDCVSGYAEGLQHKVDTLI